MTNDFGYYRKCKDCNQLRKMDDTVDGKKFDFCPFDNKDNLCEHFKRKWFLFWIPE